MKIIFATGNKGKLREAREILGPDYELLSSADAGVTEDIPETGSSFQENSLQKAEYIWKKCGVDCFSDDSGLEVDALGGAPGIYSARYGSMDAAEGSDSHDFDRNIDKLLHELTVLDTKALLEGKPAPARTARFRCVVTLMLDGEPHFFDGTCEGTIAYERKGNGGFGYDPVFITDDFPGLSMSEISEDQKNSISHRAQALNKMAEWLKNR